MRISTIAALAIYRAVDLTAAPSRSFSCGGSTTLSSRLKNTRALTSVAGIDDGVVAVGGVPGDVDVGDLAEGVDAGVGAAGAGDVHRLGAKFEDGVFERTLDRGAVVLTLPAGEGTAVIFERELPARHQTSRVPLGKA